MKASPNELVDVEKDGESSSQAPTSTKSTPSSHNRGINRASCNDGHTGKSLFQSGRLVTPGQDDSSGVPNTLLVRTSIWVKFVFNKSGLGQSGL